MTSIYSLGRKLTISVFNWELYDILQHVIRLENGTAFDVTKLGLIRCIIGHIYGTLNVETNGFKLYTDGIFPFVTFDLKRARKNELLMIAMVYRPQPKLPLYMATARRAVRFVHGVIALVTANAYISTLGGGHFLCKHLDQAKLLAKVQMALSRGLQDPILESKCRINLAYGAMQGGKFKRALRIIEGETKVANELENEELQKVCHAAKVYLYKNYKLQKEFLQTLKEFSGGDEQHRLLVDNYYRQRIIRQNKVQKAN
jgi:hypothetical protein